MADEIELPRRWRPYGARMAGWFFGVMLLVVCVAAWVTFPQDVRDSVTWSQRITLVALGAMVFGAFHALIRSRVVASEEGLEVVNGYRTHTFTWPEVVTVTLPAGAPWATLDLNDGHSVSAMGIQGSDGARARLAVRELRALLSRFHDAEPESGSD